MAWSHVLGQREPRNHATCPRSWRVLPAASDSLTPHSRCSHSATFPTPRRATWRNHEMPRDAHCSLTMQLWQIPSCAPLPCAPPWLGAFRPGPPTQPAQPAQPITLWPSADGSTFDASLACVPSSTRALEALGPAHHAIPGRTSHHSIQALTSLDLILTATPARPPCVGALFACYAISGSQCLDCHTVRPVRLMSGLA